MGGKRGGIEGYQRRQRWSVRLERCRQSSKHHFWFRENENLCDLKIERVTFAADPFFRKGLDGALPALSPSSGKFSADYEPKSVERWTTVRACALRNREGKMIEKGREKSLFVSVPSL